ncbi:MAG: hypothetical protein U0132_00795 [Gemmatimonadaceae bacterium]
MKSLQWARLTSAVAVLVSLTACADTATAPAATQPTAVALAASFDVMAQDQALAGAVAESEDWRWVAAALRNGVKPSRIEIWKNGKIEDYDAFVRAVEVPSVQTMPRKEAGRTMLAWQRDNSEQINHVLRLESPGETGRVVPHAGVHSVELPLGAHADYVERGAAGGTWNGFKGVTFLSEVWILAGCRFENPEVTTWRPPEGMMCQKALFDVRFEATFAPQNRGENELPAVTMWMATQRVVGVKLTPAN